MDKLEKKCRSTLLENPAWQIKNSVAWSLPVVTYEVAFNRVRRSQMDILMKMMLLTFEEADIRRAANFSELLLVEEMFIADLLKKMVRLGLVCLEKKHYRLTSKGRDQLNTGVFVEELEEESTVLYYSSVHDEVWSEITSLDVDRELPQFRYATERENMNVVRFFRVLSEKEDSLEENGFQTVIEGVNSYEQQTVEQIPCLEFTLYDKKQHIFFARVWNTSLARWDDTLEKIIEEKERLTWRDKWVGLDEGKLLK